ncbi:hypothetical protein NEAUS03_2174 [Nematocida ausubeli]|nr:hypothetical protein NEAUS03_2174 [Nematocida ausubeli]
MTKLNILRRKNQLEVEEDTASHPYMVEQYGVGGGWPMAYLITLGLWDIEHGRNTAELDLEILSEQHPEWRSLEPRIRIFYLQKELSKRKGEIAKRVHAYLEILIYGVGIPLKEWNEQIYDKVVEGLLKYIERERKSALEKVPKKGSSTWEEWFIRFAGHLWHAVYSFEDIAKEFQSKTEIYPRGFSEVWELEPRTVDNALRRLCLECMRQDGMYRTVLGHTRHKPASKHVCKKCGIPGHAAKHCRKSKARAAR